MRFPPARTRRRHLALASLLVMTASAGCASRPHSHPSDGRTLTPAAYLAAAETEAKATIAAASPELTRAAEEMARAALNFWTALTPEQQQKAGFDFKDEERHNWHFVPRA